MSMLATEQVNIEPSRLRVADAEQESREALMAEIFRLRTYVKELEQAADVDSLAPVYNRRAFIRELVRAQSVHQRYNIPTSVIFFDLDGFKAINDRYGHVKGDEILIAVGRTFQANIRDCDLVARLGGDEFAVLLFKTEDAVAKQKAVDLVAKIEALHINVPGSFVNVSASWGCAPVVSGMTPERVLANADERMYRNKRFKKTS